MSEDTETLARPDSALQAHLRAVDTAVTLTGLTYQEQIAVCALAAALAYRRLQAARVISGKPPLTRGQRHQIVKATMAGFEQKLREYGEPVERE